MTRARILLTCDLLFFLAPPHWMRYCAILSSFCDSLAVRLVAQGFPIFPEMHPLRIFYGKLDICNEHNLLDFHKLANDILGSEHRLDSCLPSQPHGYYRWSKSAAKPPSPKPFKPSTVLLYSIRTSKFPQAKGERLL